MESPNQTLQLPEDIAHFIERMTSYREEVNAGTPNEWGPFVREEADFAKELCLKYNLPYDRSDEEDDEEDYHPQ